MATRNGLRASSAAISGPATSRKRTLRTKCEVMPLTSSLRSYWSPILEIRSRRSFAPAAVLSRAQPEPGGELPAGAERRRIGHRGRQRRRPEQAHAGHGAMPREGSLNRCCANSSGSSWRFRAYPSKVLAKAAITFAAGSGVMRFPDQLAR